jgi:hypothetical protein
MSYEEKGLLCVVFIVAAGVATLTSAGVAVFLGGENERRKKKKKISS